MGGRSENTTVKQNRSVLGYVAVFCRCGWIARAAQKRSPGRGSQRLHRALGGTRILLAAAPTAPPCFRRRRRSAPLLFESTLASPFSRQIKQKLRYPLDTGVLGGRGWTSRAAHLKKPRRGFFPRRTVRRVVAVRIHPLYESSLVTKQKPQRICIR